MKRRLIACLSAGILAGGGLLALPAASAAAEPSAAPGPVFADLTSPPDSGADLGGDSSTYIVKFKARANARTVASAAASAGGFTVKHLLTKAFPGMVARLNPAQRAALAKNSQVEWIESDAVLTADAAELSPTWGLDRVDQRDLPLSGSYAYGPNGNGVDVFVIDTGLNYHHVEFTGRVAGGAYTVADGRGISDCNGHGTHVTGTIAGTTYGVAKKASIYPVRVMDCHGTTTVGEVVAALDWVAETHADGTPAVTNLSLGGDQSTAVDEAVAALIDDGVTVVTAAGNDGIDACSQSPARVPAALTVAASDSSDAEPAWSNYGSCVDLYAPGVAVKSAYYTSTTATAVLSGTSMAAPHVAGAAALVLSARPTWTPDEVTAELLGKASADKITNATWGTPNLLLFTSGGVSPAPLVAGKPSVSDTTPQVGQVLTAREGKWLPGVEQFTYEWLLGSSTTPVGTEKTYTVQPADVGKAVRVRVTGSTTDYASVTVTSPATSAVAKAPLSASPTPAIDDSTPAVDQTLTVQPGTWGPDPVTVAYQWYRVSAAGTTSTIAGATSTTYAVRASDVGYRLKAKVTGSKAGYTTTSKTSALTAKVAKAVFSAKPSPSLTVDGTPRVGKVLTAVPDTFTPAATSHSYQWYRGTTAITGATKATYTVSAADKGQHLKVRVTSSRAGYVTVTQYTTPTEVIQAGLPAPATPKVSDTTPQVDQTLSITNTVCPVAATDPATYQWFKGTTAISGATDATYTVRATDVGSTVKVRVSCSAPDYATVTKTSAATSAVAKATFTVKGAATITGTLQVGQELTADEGSWTPTPDSYTYQWYRNGIALTGKTARTFTPTGAGSFTVKVTARKAGYTNATATSAATVISTP